jgi:hypothetical protein
VPIATSLRIPTLAIAIRKINGTSIFEHYKEDFEKLKDEEKEELEQNEDYKKYFGANRFMEDELKKRSPEFIAELWEEWKKVEERRKEAQEAIKKSSGVPSEKEKKENTLESTPSGNQK